MVTVFLLRHGETAWNKLGRVMGRTQVPLGADGVQQIQKIAPLVATLEPDAIYTSPLRRAVQTAKVVAAETRLPICKSEGLNEIAYGEWAGRYFEDLIDDELYRRFIKSPAKTILPGGETISDVQRRGLEVIEEAAQKIPGGRFLFVSHGDVIRAILCHYMKLPLNEYRRLRVDNGSLSALQTDRRWAEIKYVNYLHEIILASKEPYMAAKATALRK
ncbi:MAG TPA: histidine phosphatase family protein [Candidatus Binatia bacterium]|nr:histidine phosphatase family protein [Candidatus Binatia bacterium]